MKRFIHRIMSFVLVALMAGCAMPSRLDPSPMKAEYLSSTKRALQYSQDTTEQFGVAFVTETEGWGGCIFFPYLIVVTTSALAADVVLAPLDTYAFWQEHRRKEKFIKHYEEKEIRPESEEEIRRSYPITTDAAGWRFSIKEDRHGWSVVKGIDFNGRTVQRDGANPDELLKQCTADAIAINEKSESPLGNR